MGMRFEYDFNMAMNTGKVVTYQKNKAIIRPLTGMDKTKGLMGTNFD